MPLRKSKTKTSRTPRQDPAVNDLLLPIVAFLRRSGMSQTQLMSEFREAIRVSYAARPGLKVIRIGFEHLSSTIVSRWLRDPMYLNHAGRPDDLPLTGKRSVTSLAKACQIAMPPRRVIAFLIEFGTVRQISPNLYRLIRRSLNFSIPTYLPYEPNLQFLIDAARASTWGSTLKPRAPRLFWQNAVSTNVSSRYFPEFLRYAKERGLLFMHEINEWLEAHESQQQETQSISRRNQKTHRVGIGLFGICRSPD
jgi:Family of unknown function (DUF6502)